MKVTSIKQQTKRTDRYSVFVDEVYAFSLSESALLESKLASGRELSAEEVVEYKKLSADDKIYNNTLRYVAMRQRTTWEVQVYLQRKSASPPLVDQILNKLSIIGMLDDEKYVESYVHDRQLLRPASRRKIISELRKKHVPGEIIERFVGDDAATETAALQAVITAKRRQAKYQDNQKLMEYLARQGFGYEDIKRALTAND